jgi:sulfide:quinone oxidoreductase
VSKTVLIAGGGPAALEAVVVLRRLAGERVSPTLLAPDAYLSYRPLSVLEPFTVATPVRSELAQIARGQDCACVARRTPERRRLFRAHRDPW